MFRRTIRCEVSTDMDERQTESSLAADKNRMCYILFGHESLYEGDAELMRNQYLSRWDIQKYLAKYPDVTKEEKKELLSWIKSGHLPYANDRYCYDASDHLLDFIGAIQAENEYWEELWRLQQDVEQ